MPTININLGSVEDTFADLPLGTYLGEISALKLVEAKPGKSDQIRVEYTVVDEQALGKKQSQFLSLSEKGLIFTKRFFAKFGLADLPTLEVNDSLDIESPYLLGLQVIFSVSQDRKDATRTRTELESVESEVSFEAPAEAGAPAVAAEAAAPKLQPRVVATPKPALAPQRRTLR